MAMLDQILSFNKQFVASKAYESFLTDRFPDKKIVIVTCMDTRLTELLPKAMNLKNGDAKFIKIAGAVATEIYVVGHHDCTMSSMGHEAMLKQARAAGIGEDVIRTLDHAGIDLESWLTGFASPAAGVHASVRMIRNHPLLPKHIVIHGLLIHPDTGQLEVLSNGDESRA